MSVSVEKVDLNLVKLEIIIDAQVAEKEYSKACKKISESINIAGFRKGKAPMNVVEKHVGEQAVQREVIENVFPQEYYKAVSENNLAVITEPKVESFEFEKGKDLKIIAKVELKPEVTLEKYKDLDFKFDEYVIAEDAVQKELESVRERFSEQKTVEENRKTTANDIVVMDFAGFVDGNEIKGGSGKNYTLDLAHSNFIPGFAEQLVDREKETDFTIEVNFPENYHEESLKGKPAQFNIKIHEIKERVLPELNDDLAKKAGKYENIGELEEEIKKYFEGTKKVEDNRRKTNVIFDYIIENTKIDIQQSMIDREKDNILHEMEEKVKMQGMDWNQFLAQEDSDKMREEIAKEAVIRIKNTLIISEIAKNENIEIKQSDVAMKLKQMAAVYRMDEKELLGRLQSNPGFLSNISQQLVGEKVSEFLLEKNNFVAEKK